MDTGGAFAPLFHAAGQRDAARGALMANFTLIMRAYSDWHKVGNRALEERPPDNIIRDGDHTPLIKDFPLIVHIK